MHQEQIQFPIPNNASHIVYTPQIYADDENWLHLILGYPKCPLIGRYNKGQYRMGDIIKHFEFKIEYSNEKQQYGCGESTFNIPIFLKELLRQIPEVIPYNKPKNLKNEPDVHLIEHKPQNKITLNFIISYGPMGNDFLNYLNHSYVFNDTSLFQNKLARTTQDLPIVLYLPPASGLQQEEVERGICMTHFRSQYMSLHLKGGAPAFSPNNMRVGIEGKRKVVTNTKKEKGNNKKERGNNKKEKKWKQKIESDTKENNNQGQKQEQRQKQNEKEKQNETKKEELANKQIEVQDDLFGQINFESLENDQKPQKQQIMECHERKINKQTNTKTEQHQQIPKHQGFIHFYTSVLLLDDHRVNYHWHIEDYQKQDIITQLLTNSPTLSNFVMQYRQINGEDALIRELGQLLKM